MNSPFTVRTLLVETTSRTVAESFLHLWAWSLVVVLGAGLASCGHTPGATTAAVPAAVPALTTAPTTLHVLAPAVPAAVPAAPLVKEVVRVNTVKFLRADPVMVVAPVVAEEVAAAPVPEPVVAPAAPATRTQAGRILDENGHPLIGATVMLRSSTKGTSTDASGSYLLEVPTGSNTFVVGYGGYEDETASSTDGQPLNVTLLPTPSGKAKSRRARY